MRFFHSGFRDLLCGPLGEFGGAKMRILPLPASRSADTPAISNHHYSRSQKIEVLENSAHYEFPLAAALQSAATSVATLPTHFPVQLSGARSACFGSRAEHDMMGPVPGGRTPRRNTSSPNSLPGPMEDQFWGEGK